jgi:hypothetical protein
MTEKQRATIIAVAKYKLHWTIEGTFSFVLTTFPELRKQLTSWELKGNKIRKLYTLLTCNQAHVVIQKLDKIMARKEKELKNATGKS